LLETALSPSTIRTLADKGHNVRVATDPYFYGSAKVIELLPTGDLAGAGDHRREACALAFEPDIRSSSGHSRIRQRGLLAGSKLN
jgi:hypothetical protein